MNSYPLELLAQLSPVMFVAGLDPLPDQTDTAQSPSPSPGKTQDQFSVLTARLRDALSAQTKPSVWKPERNKTFQVVLVDKDIRFPPRKRSPHEDHSPLSPLTPSSPLYPDGLIAPIWIRKHTTLLPSVFVVFMRIFEYPQLAPRSPLDPPDANMAREREAEERRRDSELAAEIAQRKKTTNERNIKLTVVLMASRRMLDDPSLDARLTFIRRQSGLDPRAALFVLSPVSPSEIGDFVRSLQEALYEPAVEYYTNHSKRVRRKRNRHSQATNVLPHTPLGSATVQSRPLRPEGWTVRYEYKMACFAEFRGEDEVALKHYQDAYSTLLLMFGSTAILPPRTKRWAEAKVLSDCINAKVCKLYLYNNEHALALSHHNSHMRKFADFSRGWGIGEETFEFWSWLARQHRLFAELLEQGTRSTLKIPTHLPTVASTATAAPAPDTAQRGPLEVDAMRMLGINPYQALQHPGFYYYMAARCTERRRQRFLDALELEHTTAPSPGFVNEKKVDHLTIILELYTRSYELFKKFNASGTQGQGRLTLWIAYLIAQTYYEAGKFDMAVRFFERIAKTYRREKWGSLLRPLLATWFACAQQLGDVELSVRLLIEMLAHGISPHQDTPEDLQEDLLAVLKSTVPSTPDEPLVIDSSECEPILDTSLVFWKSEVSVGEPAAFQLSLTALSAVSMTALPFSSLSIQFSSEVQPVMIRHAPADPQTNSVSVRRVEIGQVMPSDVDDNAIELGADLRWTPGSTIVFTGSVASKVPMVLKASKLLLTLNEGSWCIEIPLQPDSSKRSTPIPPRWLVSLDPPKFAPVRRDNWSTVSVHWRPHQVQVSVSHHAPAYLGEDYPISIEVANLDDRELEIIVDVLLQPSEIDESVNHIMLGGERSSSLIKGVAFGILPPGVSVVKTLHLSCTGVAGERTIDISVQSRSTSSLQEPTSPISPKSPTASLAIDRRETLRTLVVPALEPILAQFDIVYMRSLGKQPGLADLATFDTDCWDDADGGEAVINTTFVCMADSGIVVEGVKLVRQDGEHARILDSLIEMDAEDFLTDWLPGDEFCDRSRVTISLPDDDQATEPISGPGQYEVTWRRILPAGARGSLSTTTFSLPPLQPPAEGLLALLSAPSVAKLHTPLHLRLTIRNRHPTRAANITVHLDPAPDGTDGFVVAGLRNGRVPLLLPGSEETVLWKLIPIECGHVRIPRFRVVDRRKATPSAEDGEESVKVIDVRWDRRTEAVETSSNPADKLTGESTILVLP